MDDKLIHHHIDQGGTAVALPEKVHRSWNKVLHTYRGKGARTLKRGANGALSALDLFGTISGFLSNDPHGLGAQWDRISGDIKIGRMYHDEVSGAYVKFASTNRFINGNHKVYKTEYTMEIFRYYYEDKETGEIVGFDKIGEGNIIYDEDGNILSSTTTDFRTGETTTVVEKNGKLVEKQ